ncbi:unnamed protein product [Rhizoctonia solani]|nr:unnamed protein product [Rhizoctonia solani]
MPLNHLGISVWIADSEGNELPEYEVKLVTDDEIECWIPSTEGSNFKIMWRVHSPMPNHDLAIHPSLDGAKLAGVTRRMCSEFPRQVYELDSHQTGPSTVRLYTFGKRILTDREGAAKPSSKELHYLNTIVAKFTWGLIDAVRSASKYSVPQEVAPLDEKSVKKGHSGFVFRYAPRDWLKARGIIPLSPRPSPSSQIKPKRERSFDSDVIDIDDLPTDDETPMAKLRLPYHAFSATCIVSAMIQQRSGISVWIIDSEGNHLQEYQVQDTADGAIQCWVPSVEGNNFKIQWEVIGDPHPGLDLCAFPYLDGVKLTGGVLYRKDIVRGGIGQLSKESTGISSARLYEFGRRVLTDKDAGIKLDSSKARCLNTIQVDFAWGRGGDSKLKKRFDEYVDISPIHEKSAKKGHTGAAKLGKTVSIDKATHCGFYPNKSIKQATFVFCYAPEDWLRAREIIMDTPKPNPRNSRGTQKRPRSKTPEAVNVDELDTDDDEIQLIKHLVPVPVASKRQRTATQEQNVQLKIEDD